MQRQDQNDQNAIHVNLPSGKLTKSGERKMIKRQRGMTCMLYGLRRIGFFDQQISESLAIEHYKKLKHAMQNFKKNYTELIQLGLEICRDAEIDLEAALQLSKNFMSYYAKHQHKLTEIEFFHRVVPEHRWTVLYNILLEKVVLPLMHIENISWHPRDGFSGLRDSLKKHGAHAFVGKFGRCFHNPKPLPFHSQSTENRHVFYFLKDSFIGETSAYNHCIIVDDAKIVGGKEMVFFRDPNYLSSPKRPEKIFMLSFENFVARLRDWQGRRFLPHLDSDPFARASDSPEKFGHTPS